MSEKESPELLADVPDETNRGGGRRRPTFENAPNVFDRRGKKYDGPEPFGVDELQGFVTDHQAVERLGPGRLKQRFIKLSRDFHSSMADRYPDELEALSIMLAAAEKAIAQVKAHRKWMYHRGRPTGARGIGRWTQLECLQFLGEMETAGHVKKGTYSMKTSQARMRKLVREAAERAGLNPEDLKRL